MLAWIQAYLAEQRQLVDSLPKEEIARWVSLLKKNRQAKRSVFICGNGGSAASGSHFAVDLGKGASGMMAGQATRDQARFRVQTLHDNVPWLTALGNDLAYEDVYVEQLKNFAAAGDILIAVSVSGNSPNVVKAVRWANQAGLVTLGLAGNRPGNQLAQLTRHVISINSGHYGRVEDIHMMILHMLCYAFIENAA
ncbi:MAG: SIS domain-containing protein [Verrucomicrobiae bacterium]|nr:SIS domain-containing protein [Verrucomicrobiae bacterium]